MKKVLEKLPSTLNKGDINKMRKSMINDGYLERFFEEKELGYKTYEVNHNGLTHFIDSEMIIDLIYQAPETEKVQIVRTLRKIDFANGDVHHFLNFLAEQFVKTNY